MTRLTILMYHEVAVPRRGTRHLGNFVTPDQFEEQLEMLSTLGYHSISLDQWLAHRSGRGRMPPQPMVLTFDDGYRSFAEHAWPALKARGMTAIVFIVTSQIGGTNVWDADELPSKLLDASEIRELMSDGVSVGSHTHSHIALAKSNPTVVREELVRSRAVLEDVIGRPVSYLSFPYSNESRGVRRLVRDAGYAAAVRGRGRMNTRFTDPYAMNRIKFDVAMSLAQVRRELVRARWLRM